MKKDDSVYIHHIYDSIERIRTFLGKTPEQKFLKDKLRQAALARELEIIGEAAGKISESVRREFPTIPWAEMIGMRNRLIHGYFDIDYGLVYETAKKDLPKLEVLLDPVYDKVGPRSHPWRVCPIGKHWVSPHPRTIPPTERNPDGKTQVRGHCAWNPSHKDQLYADEIYEIAKANFPKLRATVSSNDLGFPNGNKFNLTIEGWTSYWNEIFKPDVPLDPNVVKALIASESGFNLKPKDQKTRTAGMARGMIQLTDQTIKTLGDEKGELKNHYLTLTRDHAYDPEIAICAGIRWLFRKRELASNRLGREATWRETVAEYKGYLSGMVRSKNTSPTKGLVQYDHLLARLRESR